MASIDGVTDPDVAELVRLDARIGELAGRLEQARVAYARTLAELNDAQRRRGELSARLWAAERAATLGGGPAPGATAAGPLPSAPAPGATAAGPLPSAPAPAPEASVRAVQNALFVLGGLLLGTAAIVFTAVAFATFGVVGRAAILTAVTGLALGVPLLALRRRLVATAETFAALGLLLIPLDGYAARRADVLGLADWPGARYAALVCAVTAVVALGYAGVTGLVGPLFGAMLAAQPVLPLLAVPAGPTTTGWAVVFAALAALDLVVVRGARGAAGGAARALRGAGWALHGATLALAGGLAVGAVVVAAGPRAAASAGLVLVGTGVVFVAAAVVARSGGLREVASATLVVLGAVAAGRWLSAIMPSYPLAAAALGAGGVAASAGIAAAFPAGRWLGPRVGPGVGGRLVSGFGGWLGPRVGWLGSRIGGAIAAGGVGLVALGMTAYAGLAELATGRAPDPADVPFDWQLPVAVALVTAAFVAVLPMPWRRDAAIAGGAFLVLGLPSSVTLGWAALSIVDVAAVAGFAVAAVLAGSARRAAVPAAASAVLTVHAVLVARGSASVGAAVFGALALAGVAVATIAAVRTRRAAPDLTDRGDAREISDPAMARIRTVGAIGGVALAGGLVAVPAAVDRGLAAAGVVPWWTWRAILAGAAVVLAALWAVCGRWPEYAPYAFAAVGASALFAAWPRTTGTGEAPAMYAAAALLLVAAGAAVLPVGAALPPIGLAVPPAVPRTDTAVPPAGTATRAGRIAVAAVTVPWLGGLALVHLAPALAALLLAPYGWLDAIWSGPPPGVGLAPGAPTIDWADAGALALLAAAAAIVSRSRVTGRGPADDPGPRPGWAAALGALAVAPLAVPAALAAAAAPWPTVPAVSLVLGLGLGLVVAFAHRFGWFAAVGVPLGVSLAGAGLAGALPTEAATLAALGLVTATGAAAGAAGRTRPARLVGWLTASVGAGCFALVAGLAAELPPRSAAFGVLGAATVVLGVAVGLRGRRPVESAAIEAAAHAGAIAALVLTLDTTRYAAAVCTLWGIAIGLRALWPAESPRRRVALAGAAAGCELLAWWLLLAAAEVALVEAYTLPAAGAALLLGWLARRGRPELSSWLAYGPALAAALLPTLATVLVEDGRPLRRLLLGVGALAIVVLGAAARRQSPVVAGGAALTVLALHELVLVWDLLPRWIPLALGGLVLVGLAMSYERRRRDMSRLRRAVGRMS
jgi:hypothetical protein